MSFAMGRASGGREESVGRPRFSQKSRELAHLLFHLVSQSNAERLMIVHEEHLRVLPKRKTLFVC
ncbi:hypothetical protein Bca4012_004664 [Brassica carinata]